MTNHAKDPSPVRKRYDAPMAESFDAQAPHRRHRALGTSVARAGRNTDALKSRGWT